MVELAATRRWPRPASTPAVGRTDARTFQASIVGWTGAALVPPLKKIALPPTRKDEPVSKSKIGSITIAGQAIGSFGGVDKFGFVAQEVGSLKVGGTTISTTAAIDDVFIGITNDFKLHEIM